MNSIATLPVNNGAGVIKAQANRAARGTVLSDASRKRLLAESTVASVAWQKRVEAQRLRDGMEFRPTLNPGKAWALLSVVGFVGLVMAALVAMQFVSNLLVS